MPDGTQRRRRRRRCVDVDGESKGLKEGVVSEGYGAERECGAVEQVREKRSRRECPVPKPGGLVGEILGFKGSGDGGVGKGSSRPP